MDRRMFLGAMAGGLLAAPVVAEAQAAGKVSRIGWLSNVSPAGFEASKDAFRLAFRDVGYVEGQDLAMEFRWADTADRLSGSATDLVRLKVDAIVAVGPMAIRAVKQTTTAEPIVMVTSGDPVELGFVASLARPGGNVTGVSFLGEELSGKLLELLKQAMPRASRVAVLWNPANTAHARYCGDLRAAARALRVTLQSVEVRRADEFEPAFGRATREHADAFLLLLDPLFTVNSRVIADFSIRNRLATIYGLRELAEAGGLMAYGPSRIESLRRAVSYVDKILKGAKPADLPVEQPTKFELVINRATRS